MAGEYGNKARELSESQTKLVDVVNKLASIEGGETEDVLRHGELPLYPGVKLVAEVLDPVKVIDDEKPVDRYSGLIVRTDEGSDIEAIWVDHEESTTSLTLGDVGAEPYADNPDGAPDYAIDSFFDRYYIEIALTNQPAEV